MRALMTAGPALKRDQGAGFNCSAIAISNLRDFSEALYILMLGCFEPDTQIKTKTGNKKIIDLNLDDDVLTYNFSEKRFEFTKPISIAPVIFSQGENKMELELEDGSKIKCTENHEFFTTNRGWVKAIDLTEFDDIKGI